jgi:alpha-1,4-digalacturonate transport system permease protein
METVWNFLSRTRGKNKLDITDLLSYLYLILGIVTILIPVIWTAFSSVKSKSSLDRFDTRLLPYKQISIDIKGYGNRDLYHWNNQETGQSKEVVKMGPTRKSTKVALKDSPDKIFKVPKTELVAIERVEPRWENYLEPLFPGKGLSSFNFPRLFYNSLFVTITATLITLLVNSMAAFALSKYNFRTRNIFMLVIIATLMIPPSIVMVPLFFVVWKIGMFGSLWGVIIPGAATPTGVFLLRQYMLTIPDELIEASRMDAASEWKIYWRIILPLSLPALAVLGILSVIWRWNDFLWPLIVLLQNPEIHTLQIGLTQFRGEMDDNLHYLLAMTVLTLLPITVVFAFLQRHITTGIASTGLK